MEMGIEPKQIEKENLTMDTIAKAKLLGQLKT